MRAKELRLALVCYGGISLAVYMHGITKEIWRLARAGRGFDRGAPAADGSEGVYQRLLGEIADEADLHVHVFADIIAGASAGGINGIFLAQAIATGQSLEPLTDLWLDTADVDVLIDPAQRPMAAVSKLWAAPIAWAAGRRSGGATADLDAAVRAEVRAKLTSFVQAKWFAPPFSGDGFTRLLLDAFDAMAASPCGAPLLPDGQPLDLMVTVTDFHGHPERLTLNTPAEIVETEHRLTIGFSDRGEQSRTLGDAAALAFAARATASFPGAFPPFGVAEMDRVLAETRRGWPNRETFLASALPRHHAIGAAEKAVLIDGSVLANAPFRPAIDALRDRPAAREVDRRFVYIDPKPSLRGQTDGSGALPGFFQTIFGALSDIPREQPIRDNLEAIEARSGRIARTARIVESIRGEVEAAIEAGFGSTWFLDSPTPARLAAWRNKAQGLAARAAGYAYASYGQLKLSAVADDLAQLLVALAGGGDRHRVARVRAGITAYMAAEGISAADAIGGAGAAPQTIGFLRDHDLGFRIRRLRFVARRLGEIEHQASTPDPALDGARDAVYASLSLYLDRQRTAFYGETLVEAADAGPTEVGKALARLAAARDLRLVDDRADDAMAHALAALPKAERRALLLAYLGFPFYDVATLPLLGDGQDEFNPVRVDRIAPDDCASIREGGAEATLKGIRFNAFGAFFARAYRENDYLWGRLHGAERLIDIVVSTLPEGRRLPPGRIASLKRDAFRAILAEERERLATIPELLASLEREIG
ncbi:patatin-like protein [Sphingomonas sp. 1P06PA]|uniref:patatin-like protein n=1 Tax=Sphingomonas sp. 1P06PA TaxID=554121 RepID=UPI0039A64242